ncbi:FGGY-family carbohydrate kinase [Ligilactobacillus apodemi]|uniref:FGGY-family carbohydrate kinase n=1 Tax=Ligilactobacillus apodemi TaxID=307126 RepID=UPI00214C9B68|nr:FGGY-family carbohydrate kinase [Ligilactobacillus apodemi]MCR1901128.1 carbohydrate kinase [Ligilactobacillus apodemi]
MEKYFLSIDNGGTNTKIIIFDHHGNELGSQAFPTKDLSPKPGFHELDLVQLRQDVLLNIKQALKKTGLTGEQISAVVTVGHGKGLYVLDQAGEIMMNGILSADSRAKDLAVEFEKKVATVYDHAKQHVMASQAPVLLAWLKKHDPKKYAQIGSVLANKDLMGYFLTGEIKQEIGDASGNHFLDLATGHYDSKLFEFFGIEEMYLKMPPLIKATDVRGKITPEVAKMTGLVTGTPVFGGLFDIDACALATGVLAEDKFSVIAGTWNINTFPSEKTAPLASGLMNSLFPTDKWLVEASSPTSAGNLALMIKLLLEKEVAQAKDKGKTIYDDLEVFLANSDATFTKLIYFPFLYGSNVSTYAKASFLGLDNKTTRSEMIRAVYEGIVFAHYQHLTELLSVAKTAPFVVRISGGATNSKAWVQMFADVFGLPVETVAASELGGLGGALTCAVGLGLYPDFKTACSHMVTVKERFEPNQKQHALYAKKYQIYQALLTALEPVWSKFDER